MRQRRKIVAWALSLLATVAVLFGLATTAFAAPQPPEHKKTLTPNGDGTYTLSLSVTGSASESSEETSTHTNVVIVVDTSNSMSQSASGSSGTRMAATKTAVKRLAENLLGNNTEAHPTAIQLALVSFNQTAKNEIGATTSLSDFNSAVDNMTQHSGTNWEDALKFANNVSFGDNDPTYVIFVTDGQPTQYSDHTDNFYDNYTCYTNASDDARTIVSGGKTLYGIFAYGSGDNYLDDLINYAYNSTSASSTNYFNASNTTALEEALKAIQEQITTAVGYNSVEIKDGVTALTDTAVSTSISGTAEGFTYTRSGGEYGEGQAWEGAPAATFVNNTVDWNLSSVGTLEDGVTYTVSFVVWPSQESYDLIAALNNGDKSYDDLTDAEKLQVVNNDGVYSLRTNTAASVDYTQTTTVNGEVVSSESGTASYDEPKPMALDVTTMTVTKDWTDTLTDGEDRPDSVTLMVTEDGVNFQPVVLSESNHWTQTVYISPGIKVTPGDYGSDDDGVLPGAEGHEYSVTESDLDLHYELNVEPVHPMLNGLTTDDTTDMVDANSGETWKGGKAALTATNVVKGGINVKKVVTTAEGVTAPSGAEFTFTITLTDAEGNPVYTTTTGSGSLGYRIFKADGTTVRGDIPQTGQVTLTMTAADSIRIVNVPAGTKYVVTEGNLPDGFVQVSNVDGGDGAVHGNDSPTVTITNTYKATGSVKLEATKEISGAAWPAGKTITFTLAGEGGTLPEAKTKTLTAPGTVTFDAITYDESDIGKEYTYTITEDGFGTGWTAKPGKVVTAKVKVEDNGNGTLKTTVTYDPTDKTITNTYAAEGEATLQVIKAISGAAWPEGKTLTFTLAGEGGTLPEAKTKTLTAPGTVTFDAITYDESDIGKEYTYTITEDGFGDGWTADPASKAITAKVKVEDNGNGTLKTTVTYTPEDATFTNKYAAEGKAELSVSKELVGREWKEGESYTFTLYGPDGEKIEDKQVTANGAVSFTTLTYDQSDMYTNGSRVKEKDFAYTISETTKPLPEGVTKSSDVVATVKVTDKGDGTLDTAVTYTNDGKIINTYEAKPVKAQIEVKKKVDGFIEGTDVHGNTLDRTFTITMTGPKIDGELSTKITTEGGTGTAKFDEIEYTFKDMVNDEGKQVTTKDFEYTVKETVETHDGWTYDTNEYTVTVTVEDDQNGKLEVTNITKVDESEDSPNVEIVNEYEEKGTEVTLHVTKTIDDQSNSAEDASFTFQLLDADGAKVDEKTVTTEGLKREFSFEKLTFTEAGTYNYTIKEIPETKLGWTYDEHEYAVKIVVADDFSIAKLTVTEKSVDGEEIDGTINVTFTNVYKAEATKATLKVTKEVDDKSGSADPDKTFTFTLTGDKYMPKTTTATIKAGGTAEFGPIDYDKAGTFNYTITESDGSGAAWTYDTTSYPVTVKVVDENAKLVATVTYDGETTDVDGETILKVTNIYDPEDAKATPEARKLIKDLSNSAPDETFTFTLTPQGGAPGEAQTVTRENGGLFSFGEITFDKVGIYNYTIQETAGSTNGFTYDTAEHALTINVTDPGDGQLEAKVEYADANEDGELVITNIYEAEPTSLVLDVEKVISGPVDPKEDATFTFELTGDAEMTTSVTGEGTASFDEIKYTEAGTYYYTVTEVPGDSDDYIYDGTVYTVTVEVVDEGGKLVATPTISADGADVDSIVFDNPYVPEVGLKVTKTVASKPANGSYYKEGETVKYKIVVTNTGECDLTDVKVDDELTGDHWVVKKLAAGASKDFTASYKVTKDDVKAGGVLNVVTAEADNPVDPEKPLKDKDDVKVPTGSDKTPPTPPRKKVVPQTGDDTPTGAMAAMTVFGAAALTAGTVLKRKRK